VSLTHILIFSLAALLVAPVGRARWRGWLMLAGSALAIYWLQSSTPIRHLDFWLPTASLSLTVFVWIATRSPTEDAEQSLRSTLATGAVLTAIVLTIGLMRYLGPVCCLTPSPPPNVLAVGSALAGIAAFAVIFARVPNGSRSALILGLLLAAVLIALKTEISAQALSVGLRRLTGQSISRASALDIRWLGISYLAFRLLHVVIDRLNDRLPALSLQEFIVYVVFFPTLTAGPIDRAERIVKDLREPYFLSAPDLWEGGSRIVIGMFKKFALADSLALIALNETNAAQTDSTLWLWVLLYGYAFRLFFDFAGLSDIAIGLGRLMGIKTPENFDRPYLKTNLTTFWNSWHMTLAQWFRAYFFNPVTRGLRARGRLPVALIIAVGQLGTMLLIGLWHGVTWNFTIWGAWHGVGLFVHNRWANLMRARVRKLESRPVLKSAYTLVSLLITFHYVALGWVWFALPEIDLSWDVFRTLFGM
jgi:D-alanyl-lipoteichoic acid acyltransferase DltB (MBOAT superfamily)